MYSFGSIPFFFCVSKNMRPPTLSFTLARQIPTEYTRPETRHRVGYLARRAFSKCESTTSCPFQGDSPSVSRSSCGRSAGSSASRGHATASSLQGEPIETETFGTKFPFAGLSTKIHRGFKFDRIYPSEDIPPEETLRYDQMALMSLKTQEVPKSLMDKIVKLLKDFGQKRDLERYGRYLLKKTRSRTSSETPSVLSSWFLPEQRDEHGPLEKLRKNPAFKDLFDHTVINEFHDSTMRRLAAANAEDRRHVLFQQSWSPEAALAYTAHRYPASWATNLRILYEVARRVPDFKPASVMDYGAGPSPGLAAAAEVWPNAFNKVVAVEPSDNMAQLGKYITSDLALFSDHAAQIEWRRCLYDSQEKFDLVIASYVQMEVRGQASRDTLVKQMWNKLSPGGVLVIVEPGTPTGFRFIHHTRELFISSVGLDNFHFVAPCAHEGMCPVALTGRDWCHFGQRVRRTPHKVYCKGSTRRFMEEEKYSFLVVRSCQGPRRKYRNEAEAPTVHEKSFFWPRVMYAPIKASQHALIDVCSAPQNFERLSVSKSKPHLFGYRFARKAMWGDLWRFPKRIARPEARLYIPEKTRQQLDRLAKTAFRALKWDERTGHQKEKERDTQYYGS